MQDTDKLIDSLGTSKTKGLSNDQAVSIVKSVGKNQLTEKKGMPWYLAFLKEQTGFFSLLLWFGSLLCFIGYGIQTDKETDRSNLYLGIVLAVVVFVTGCFSYM